MLKRLFIALLTLALLGAYPPTHVIVMIQENRTPDNLFGASPPAGADIAPTGVKNGGANITISPTPFNMNYDPAHSHTAFLNQWDNGMQDGFPNGANVSAYVFAATGPIAGTGSSDVAVYINLAKAYAMADRMFGNQGPSLPAHQYFIRGTSTGATAAPSIAPNSLRVAENTAQQSNATCDATAGTTVQLMDPLGVEDPADTMFPCYYTTNTIVNLLDTAGVSWKWYESNASNTGYWQPADAIYQIRNGSDWANVIRPEQQILTDIANGQLASVSFVSPSSNSSDHPGSADGSGPAWVAAVINAVNAGGYWPNTVVIVVWDDWGGLYDHVRPPMFNQYEDGFRVPLIMVGTFARPAFVSHKQHEFGSIMNYIEQTFSIPGAPGALHTTDMRADDLRDMETASPSAFTTPSPTTTWTPN